MEILNLIEAKEKAKQVVDSCVTEEHLKAAEKYVELFRDKFEDNLSYYKLRKEINNKYRKLDKMEVLKDIMYAGLGLAKQTEDKFKERYDVLVAKGKRVDEEGKNVVNDFFKTIEEGKEKMGESYNERLTKLEEFIGKLKG